MQIKNEFSGNDVTKIIKNFLENYDQLEKNADLEQFLIENLENSKAFDSHEKIRNTVIDICTTTDLADDSFQSLRNSKSKGITTVSWLRDKISSVIENLPDEDQNSILKETKHALQRANDELFSILYENRIPDDLSEPITNYDFKDINATAIIQNLKKEVENNSLFGAITYDEGFKIEIDAEHKEIKAVKDFFTAKVDAPEDKAIKKVVTAAVEVAKEKGFKPLEGKTTTEIALMVDRCLSNAKLAYKIGTGEMNPIEVSDYMIDRAASTLSVVIKRSCQKAGSNAGAAVGTAIGAIFGPAGAAVGSVIGKTVGYIAGTAIGAVVGKGVEKVAALAKETVKTVWEGAKSVANSCWEGAKNVCSSIASIFGF